MKFGSSKLLISAAVAVAFPSLSAAAPFFSHINDASVDDSTQECQDFRITYPVTSGLSWTDGSMHTLAWQATSSYSSVAIALVDAQNQTVSDFGSYDASQGVTGEKSVSLQGHPNGLYHFEFTVKAASEAECKLSSESIQITGDDHTNADQTSNDSSSTPPSDADLDKIFADLSSHPNDGWSSTEHEDDVNGSVSSPSDEDLDKIFDDLSDHPNDGWSSTEHEDDVNGSVSSPSDEDLDKIFDDLSDHPNDGWTSHDDDVDEVPSLWHSDEVTDFVTSTEAHDADQWISHDDDVEANGNDDSEPKDFAGLIDSLDQPFDQYLQNNNATEGQTLTSHKNAVDDTGDDGWTVDEGDAGNSDISATLDEIFSKLSGNQGATDDSTTASNATTTTPTDDNSHTDIHWNSEDDSYFTEEFGLTDDNNEHNDDAWEEDDGQPQLPSTNDDSAEPQHWHSDDNSYFTEEYSNGADIPSNADNTAAHSNAGWQEGAGETDPTADVHDDDDAHSKWSGDGSTDSTHSDVAPNNWFTDGHTDDAAAPGQEDIGVPELHGNDSPADNWFTDVHNDEIVPPSVQGVPESHGNDVAPNRWFDDVHNNDVPSPGEEAPANNWFTDVHNDEIVPPSVQGVPESHGNDADPPNRWFDDVHNDEVVPSTVQGVPETHGNDAAPPNRWFNEVHNDDVASPGEGVPATNWFTDVHNDEVVPPSVQGVPETHANEDPISRWTSD